MTFSVHAAGTKDQVRRQLDGALQRHTSYNQKHEELAKVLDLVNHHLDTGAYDGGVYVEANGHLDTWGGSLQLTIKPLQLAPEAEPKPDSAPDSADGSE